MLPNGTPRKPFAERKVTDVLKQNAPATAPDERRNLAIEPDNQASTPTTLTMQATGQLARLIPWQASQLRRGKGYEFGCWDAFGFNITGRRGIGLASRFTLNWLLGLGGCLSLLTDRLAAAVFAG